MFDVRGLTCELTDERADSSYGNPVLAIQGKVVGQVRDSGAATEPDCPEIIALSALADLANIHNGPATRRALHGLAAEMAVADSPWTGAFIDSVIAEFKRRGSALHAEEIVDEGRRKGEGK